MSRYRSAEPDPKPRAAIPSPSIAPDTAKARILIVSSVRLYRDALALRLGQNERLTIVGAVEPSDALAEVARFDPDLVLLDAGEWHGLDLAETLLAHRPEVRIVALAVPELAGYAIAATWRGIAGFVPRNGSIDDVVAVLEGLKTGSAHEPAAVAAPGLLAGEALKRRVVPRPPVAGLTPRQGEILEMIELGLSNKEIARNLHIRLGTVKNHVHNILEKLDVRCRNQAAHRMRARSLSG